MGMHGQLVFFTESSTPEPQRWLEDAFKLFSATHVGIASRWTGSEWDSFLKIISGECTRKELEKEMGWASDEMARGPISVHEASGLYRDGSFLSVHVRKSDLCQRMVGITGEISEDIRDYFTPCNPIITIGYHDIFESLENEKGHLFGRAFFSVKFDSPGMPHNPKEYRRLLFEIPEIDEIRKEFESIVGPLEQCVYWDG